MCLTPQYLVCQSIHNQLFAIVEDNLSGRCRPPRDTRLSPYFPVSTLLILQNSVRFLPKCVLVLHRALEVTGEIQSTRINSFPRLASAPSNASWICGDVCQRLGCSPHWPRSEVMGVGSRLHGVVQLRVHPCQSCSWPEDVPNTLQAQTKYFGLCNETKLSVTRFSFSVTNWLDQVYNIDCLCMQELLPELNQLNKLH